MVIGHSDGMEESKKGGQVSPPFFILSGREHNPFGS